MLSRAAEAAYWMGCIDWAAAEPHAGPERGGRWWSVPSRVAHGVYGIRCVEWVAAELHAGAGAGGGAC